MRYLELNAEGVVVNIVVWNGIDDYRPQGIAQLLPCDQHAGVSFGWRLVNNEWIAPTKGENDA